MQRRVMDGFPLAEELSRDERYVYVWEYGGGPDPKLVARFDSDYSFFAEELVDSLSTHYDGLDISLHVFLIGGDR